MEKQTAGRDQLGEFAPKFAELNDDVLFGQVWSREDKLSLRDRSLVTISVFMGRGLIDSSLKHHIMNAKKNSWFSHLAIEVPGENTNNEWCEPVTDEEYNKLGE